MNPFGHGALHILQEDLGGNLGHGPCLRSPCDNSVSLSDRARERRWTGDVRIGVAVFPGQGSQFAGMADPWARIPRGARCSTRPLRPWAATSWRAAGTRRSLATTEFAQPALLACDVAAFRVLEAAGVRVRIGAAGHSLGEFAALVAAEVLSFADALRIVVVRGREMQRGGRRTAGHDERAARRRSRRRCGALRRGARRRRAARRERELAAAGRDQRERRGDRTRGGAVRRRKIRAVA